jgi:hypothetical protein
MPFEVSPSIGDRSKSILSGNTFRASLCHLLRSIIFISKPAVCRPIDQEAPTAADRGSCEAAEAVTGSQRVRDIDEVSRIS